MPAAAGRGTQTIRKPKIKGQPETRATQAGSDAALEAVKKLEERMARFSELSRTHANDAGARLRQMKEGKLSDMHTWSVIHSLMQYACEHKESELKCIANALKRLQPFSGQSNLSAKISVLEEKSESLRGELDTLRRDAMRNTLDAIMHRPTDQAIRYLHEQKKIMRVTRPTWVELKAPDDEYRDEKQRAPKHYVIEYVMTFKADDKAPNRKCVLHAHYDRPDPPDGCAPMKSHYKRHEERRLGKASETRLADGTILDPVYRNLDASSGLRIAREMLKPEERKPVPRAQSNKRAGKQ